MQTHAFDQAIALTAQGGDHYLGHTSRAYWNMVGPFGGITAATALNAVLQHPSLLGEPVSLTVNYASALVQGPFTITARAARTNRSTQHWVVEVQQLDADGAAPHTVLTATVLTAVRRTTWGVNDTPMPVVPGPDELLPQPPFASMEWVSRYDIRAVLGAMPHVWDGAVRPEDADSASLTRLWLRDAPLRPLDFCSLAAYADVFFPRIYLRRASAVPVGTVSMTVYFHVGNDFLHRCASAPVLGQARGQVFRDGFFDQNAQLWSASGELLVTSSQLVYYKH